MSTSLLSPPQGSRTDLGGEPPANKPSVITSASVAITPLVPTVPAKFAFPELYLKAREITRENGFCNLDRVVESLNWQIRSMTAPKPDPVRDGHSAILRFAPLGMCFGSSWMTHRDRFGFIVSDSGTTELQVIGYNELLSAELPPSSSIYVSSRWFEAITKVIAAGGNIVLYGTMKCCDATDSGVINDGVYPYLAMRNYDKQVVSLPPELCVPVG